MKVPLATREDGAVDVDAAVEFGTIVETILDYFSNRSESEVAAAFDMLSNLSSHKIRYVY